MDGNNAPLPPEGRFAWEKACDFLFTGMVGADRLAARSEGSGWGSPKEHNDRKGEGRASSRPLFGGVLGAFWGLPIDGPDEAGPSRWDMKVEVL